MKKYFLLILLLPFIQSFKFSELAKSNNVYGKVILSDCQDRIVKGNGYRRDGIEFMHSDDPLAQTKMNVIVSLHPLDFKPIIVLSEDAYITQNQQTFIPSVLPIVVGSNVHFLNEDEYFHNVQSLASKSRFSIGRRAPGISYSRKIDKTGAIEITCDIHEHMKATILSFDTPYFCRLKEDGTYSIKDLPDGKYRLEIYHPTCQNISKDIEIMGDKSFEQNFHISDKA